MREYKLEDLCTTELQLVIQKLERAGKSIDDIAQETGFFDTSYFIRIFKRNCGLTPLQYRRKHTHPAR